MYFKLGLEDSEKKWDGYENPDSDFYVRGEELTSCKGYDILCRRNNIEYINLTEGKLPPANSIGARFIIFDASIKNIRTLIDKDAGVDFIKLTNKTTHRKCLLLCNSIEVDCVDWELSDVDHWPEGAVLEEWENKRGRFFITPVLKKEAIPANLKLFRLSEWRSPFNYIISEEFKEKILRLDFDHSFLTFEPLEIV